MTLENPDASVVALIPARGGSKRVKNKNVRKLGDHPLIAYAISAAIQSEVFGSIVVSTESETIAEIARHYGAEVPVLRPGALAEDHSPDIEWVEFTLRRLLEDGRRFDAYSILRPTSPFRSPQTIQRAWGQFQENRAADSLRAVEPCRQHPGKMWVIRGKRLHPLLPFGPPDQPWHSSPTQSLPQIFVQNASLEISWCRVALEGRSIAGETILPFLTEEWEGFDINVRDDFERAEQAFRDGQASLPHVSAKPWPGE